MANRHVALAARSRSRVAEMARESSRHSSSRYISVGLFNVFDIFRWRLCVEGISYLLKHRVLVSNLRGPAAVVSILSTCPDQHQDRSRLKPPDHRLLQFLILATEGWRYSANLKVVAMAKSGALLPKVAAGVCSLRRVSTGWRPNSVMGTRIHYHQTACSLRRRTGT